jgi:CheY-like chemotaxis protein
VTDDPHDPPGDGLFYEVRRALTNLYDPIYLQRSPLTALLQRVSPPAPPGQEARALRQCLIEAIERLAPSANVPLQSGERRGYQALRGRYVNQTPVAELARALAISERQLRRDIRQGIEALTAIIAGLLALPDREWPQEPPSSGAPALSEVARFGAHAGAVNLCEEVRNVQTLVSGLAREAGVTLRDSGVPESVVVRANRVILRQVVVSLYSQMIQSCPGEVIASRVSIEGSDYAQLELTSPSASDQIPLDLLQTELVCLLNATLTRDPSPYDPARQPWGGLCLRLRLPCMPTHGVLLVDDNEGLHHLFRRYLSGLPYRLLSAYNTEEGFTLACEERPDVILLDIMMPNRDGWELLSLLQNDAHTRDIPIVVCSVLEQKALARSLSVRFCLRKPVDQKSLVSLLQQLAPFDAG